MHLDSDDLLVPGAVATLMKGLASSSGYQIAAGRLECFLSPDITDGALAPSVSEGPQRGHLPGVAILRKDTFETFGALDKTFAVGADLEWWVRARDKGARIHLMDDVVLRRRIHGRNNSILHSTGLGADQLKIVRESLARKRVAQGLVIE